MLNRKKVSITSNFGYAPQLYRGPLTPTINLVVRAPELQNYSPNILDPPCYEIRGKKGIKRKIKGLKRLLSSGSHNTNITASDVNVLQQAIYKKAQIF